MVEHTVEQQPHAARPARVDQRVEVGVVTQARVDRGSSRRCRIRGCSRRTSGRAATRCSPSESRWSSHASSRASRCATRPCRSAASFSAPTKPKGRRATRSRGRPTLLPASSPRSAPCLVGHPPSQRRSWLDEAGRARTGTPEARVPGRTDLAPARYGRALAFGPELADAGAQPPEPIADVLEQRLTKRGSRRRPPSRRPPGRAERVPAGGLPTMEDAAAADAVPERGDHHVVQDLEPDVPPTRTRRASGPSTATPRSAT